MGNGVRPKLILYLTGFLRFKYQQDNYLCCCSLSPLCIFKRFLKLLTLADAKSHSLHLFEFFPICIFKSRLKYSESDTRKNSIPLFMFIKSNIPMLVCQVLELGFSCFQSTFWGCRLDVTLIFSPKTVWRLIWNVTDYFCKNMYNIDISWMVWLWWWWWCPWWWHDDYDDMMIWWWWWWCWWWL